MSESHLVIKLEHLHNPDWHFTEDVYKTACAEALAAIRKLRGDEEKVESSQVSEH